MSIVLLPITLKNAVTYLSSAMAFATKKSCTRSVYDEKSLFLDDANVILQGRRSSQLSLTFE